VEESQTALPLLLIPMHLIHLLHFSEGLEDTYLQKTERESPGHSCQG